MTSIIPRFEYRTFAYDFGLQKEKLYQLAVLEEMGEHTDIYLITAENHSHSVKVRDGRLSIKYLIQTKNGLEQWRPVFATDFPITASELNWEIFTSLNTVAPSLEYATYDQEIFWEKLIKPHPSIQTAFVVKNRFRFRYRSCRAEISCLWINGFSLQTLAIEDESDEAVHQFRNKLGLQSCENVNYPLAIERILNTKPQWDALANLFMRKEVLSGSQNYASHD